MMAIQLVDGVTQRCRMSRGNVIKLTERLCKSLNIQDNQDVLFHIKGSKFAWHVGRVSSLHELYVKAGVREVEGLNIGDEIELMVCNPGMLI